MVCNNCGVENPSGNRFCGNCGMRLIHHQQVHSEAPAPETTPIAFSGSAKPSFNRQEDVSHVSQNVPDAPVPFTTPSGSRLHDSHKDEVDSAFWQSEPPPLLEDRPETDEKQTPSGNRRDISGPSFLGLGDGEPSDGSLEYLYDDGAGSSGAWRKVLALAIAVAFIAFIVHEWRQNPSWQSTIARYWPVSLHRGTNTPGTDATNNNSADSVTQTDTATNSQNGSSDVPPPPDAAQIANLAGTSADSNLRRLATDPNDRAVTQIQLSELAKKSGRRSTDAASQSDLEQTAASSKEDVSDRHAAAKQSTRSASTSTRRTAAQGAAIEAGNQSSKKEIASATTPVRKTVPETPSQPPGSELVKKADAYLYGRGAPRSCQQALTYLHSAANQGNAVARGKLGTLYATGHCVHMDNVRAYNWFSLAIAAGGKDPLLLRNRQMIWNKMNATEQARARQLEP